MGERGVPQAPWMVSTTVSYVDFSRLCYVIFQFPGFRPELLKYGVTFTLSKSKGSIEWINVNIDSLNHYANQINTNIYNEYNILNKCFQDGGT